MTSRCCLVKKLQERQENTISDMNFSQIFHFYSPLSILFQSYAIRPTFLELLQVKLILKIKIEKANFARTVERKGWKLRI